MKIKFLSHLTWLFCISAFAQQQSVLYTYSFTPSTTLVGTDSFTINVLGSSINEAAWGVTNNELYAWTWALNAANQDIPFSGNGAWANSNASQLMTYNAGTDTYSFTFSPTIFQYYNSTNVAKVGFLIKARNGTGDKKSQDIVTTLNAFELNLSSHVDGATLSLPAGSNITFNAQNTGGAADYVLTANGIPVPGSNSTGNSFTYTYNNTPGTTTGFVILATVNGVTKTRSVTILFTPSTQNQAMPANLIDGINYSSDHTKTTLVLNAPFKDYIYVAGTFNNWAPFSQYLMRKDPTTGKYWLEITGLTPGTWYAFQYWVGDETARPATSPALVKTADPFSTLVLSPYDDPEIVQLGVYPGLPVYNTIAPGQNFEVSVIQTGTNTFRSYNWNVTNFQKPTIKDLVVHEVLVRDFDAQRTYQNLINRFDYFKNSNINAIQLMPVMEFEGNLSWGYNTSYHMAIDKRYGPPAKLKEFIDLCHQNGIAVILDIALNHVFGRSPLERMWMLDSNNDGFGNASAENPYCNTTAMHSYSVGTDLNHFREPDNLTNTYVMRTLRHWIEEYKIDGYRWDLTKGFTNQCNPTQHPYGSANEFCTNGYRSDRVAKLKWYADKQWEVDNSSYVIFEHLGSDGSRQEELEWSGYRLGEGKGIMFWNKQTDNYANLVKGNANGINNVTIFGDNNRGMGYAESHDEEHVIFKAVNEAGQTQGNLNKALLRLSAQGAMHLLVPNPKMIWQFGALGWDSSIFMCSNGTNNFPNDAIPGDCKLDAKPMYAWTQNWMQNVNRRTVYDNWARFNDLRIRNNVFEFGQFSINMVDGGRKPRLDVWTSTSPQANLSYVIVLTNFSDNQYNVSGGFPYTGTWVNLMDNSTFNVSSTTQNVSIEPGGFRVFGNQQPLLSTDNLNALGDVILYPNPSTGEFFVNLALNEVELYNMKGQLVKSFKGSFEANQAFDISNLNGGVYLVKIQDQNGYAKSIKLIIE
jgi:glycosidase